MNKRWWESKTVWAGVATVLIGLAGAIGAQVPNDLTPDWAGNTIAKIATAAGTVIAGALAIWGRVKATKFIGR